MNLFHLLREREKAGTPIRVALIGAGRFTAMFLSQVRHTPGIHVVGIADLDVARARDQLARTGFHGGVVAPDLTTALTERRTAVVTDAAPLIESPVDVVVEATGDPAAGVAHTVRAIEARRHVVMVNVEADVLAGPALARRAQEAGVVYSLAYGDQPAMVWELVDWARVCGFEVTCAGKGTKYLPSYQRLNPDNVWEAWEFSPGLIASGQLNPYTHTSFRDGTKAAIEMAAVANAAILQPAEDGLGYPPASTYELAAVCRPRADGGTLDHAGTVEVVSSVDRAGNWVPNHIQEGVFVVVKAPNDYAKECFAEYPWNSDDTHQYVAMSRPIHMVGMELCISIANTVLNGVPTGTPTELCADVVAVAKRSLHAGGSLDGEGGYSVRGVLVPAEKSLRMRALPIGLARGLPLARDVAEGSFVTWGDVRPDADTDVLRLRRDTEKLVHTR